MNRSTPWLLIVGLACCTVAGTASAQPVNDLCTGALPINCGDIVIESTTTATVDTPATCGTTSGTGGGVWYSFIGTGDQVTLNTCQPGTTYDTKIRVYEGTCAALVCVTGNDDITCTPIFRSEVEWLSVPGVEYLVLVHGFGAAVGTFEMTVICLTPGVEICDDGLDNDLDGLADCADTVDCGGLPQCDESANCGDLIDNDADGLTDCADTVDCPTGVAPCIAPPNDDCLTALPINCGDVVIESTTLANPDPMGTCGTTDGTGGGVWYSFIGTGDQVTLTTCNPASNYDTKIRVWEGPCATPICVVGNDDMGSAACPASGLRSRVQWLSVPGVEYLILVHGFSSAEGIFELSVSCLTPGVEICDDGLDNDLDSLVDCADPDCTGDPACVAAGNDFCPGALPISCGDVAFGNTTAATVDTPATCTTTSGTAGGLWYSYLGNGDQVTLTTCNAGTTFDTKIRVYSGTCAAPVCVIGNDNATCALGTGRSTVQWLSTPGVEYLVLVHGLGAAAGNFELSVSCVTPGAEICNDSADNDLDGLIDCADIADCCGIAGCPSVPPNDACASATVVGLGSPAATGNLFCATNDGTATCGASATNRDVWFSFTAPFAGSFIFNTCGTHDAPGVNLGMDTVLSALDACGGVQLACNDDNGAPGCGGLNTGILRDSSITLGLAASQTVLLRLSHFGSVIADGNFVLNVASDCGVITPVTCSHDCALDATTLTWTANAQATGYEIFQNAVLVGTAGAGASSFTVNNPPVGTNAYEVAWDCALGGSGASGFCTVTVTDTAIPAGTTDLILDNESANLTASGVALEAALIANGRSVFRVNAPDFDLLYGAGCLALDTVESIWCTFGTFPADYRITAGEGDLLADLNRDFDIGVYFEGGDHWGFLHVASLFDDRDGVGTAVDGGDTFNSMLAQFPGFGPDMTAAFPASMTYTQAAAGNDWTDQLTVNADLEVLQAGAIWANDGAGEPAFITGIYAEHTVGANTMVQSWEFGGFPAADQAALAGVYLDMLERTGGGGCPSPGPSQFRRGDCNKDGLFNIADPINALGFLFPPPGGGPAITCLDALDGNDDGLVNIADPIALLGVLFPSVTPPPTVPPPAAACGCDPTADTLDCLDFAPVCP